MLRELIESAWREMDTSQSRSVFFVTFFSLCFVLARFLVLIVFFATDLLMGSGSPEPIKKHSGITNKKLYQNAIHEAGHAVVLVHTTCLKMIDVGIRKRSNDRFLLNKMSSVDGRVKAEWRSGRATLRQGVIDFCSICYAGTIAERFFGFGDGEGDTSDHRNIDACLDMFIKARFGVMPSTIQTLYALRLKAKARKHAREIVYREKESILAVADLLKRHPGQAISAEIVIKLITETSVNKVALLD